MLISSIVPKLPTHPDFAVVDVLAASDFGWEYLIEDADGLWVLEEFLPSAETPGNLAALQAELQQLVQLATQVKHPQLAHSLAVLHFDERLFCLREYVPGTSYQQLFTQLLEQEEVFSEAVVWDWLTDVLRPLAALHDRSLVHGALDLHAVIGRTGNGEIVVQRFGGIREFGLAHHFYQLQPLMRSTRARNLPGTAQDLHDLAWMALLLLTGQAPIDSPAQVLQTLQQDAVIRDEFAAILASMLIPSAWRPFRDAADVLQALEQTKRQTEISLPAIATPTRQTFAPPSIPRSPQPQASMPSPPKTAAPQPQAIIPEPITMLLSIVFIGLISFSLWRIAQTIKIPLLTRTAKLTQTITPVKPNVAASNSVKQPVSDNANSQEKQGIPAPLYDRLMAELSQDTQSPEQPLNSALQRLSKAARREMGTYYRRNYDRWFATLASRNISQPTVDILSDTSFYLKFPALRDKPLNPRAFGQIWYAMARDYITGLNQQQNLKILKAGIYNESGQLHHGRGRVFQVSVRPGQQLQFWLKTSQRDVRLSVIENEIVLMRYSTNQQWTAPKSQRGATYEIILTPVRSASVAYKMSLKAW
jgi:serine/threonine-protein kinase